MSNQFAILRHNKTKFKSFNEIDTAEKHNKRDIGVPNADPTKTHKRVHGGSSASETLKNLLNEHNIKPRKNAALANEYVLTFSPEMKGKFSLNEWVKSNIDFMKKEHGIGVLSIDLHLDESTPHLHVIVAPLIEKTVRGKQQMRLSGVDFWKGKDKLSARQDRYAEAMQSFGLERGLKGSRATHTTIQEFYKILNAANKDHSKTYQDTIKKYKDLDELEQPSVFGIKKGWNTLTADFRKTLTRLGNALKIITRLDTDKKLLQSDLERSQATVVKLSQRLSSSNVQELEQQIENFKLDVEILEDDLTKSEYKNLDLVRDNNELNETIKIQQDVINNQADKLKLLDMEQNLNRSREDQSLQF